MLHDKVTKLQFEEGGGGFRTCLLSIQESFKTQESFKIHLRVIQESFQELFKSFARLLDIYSFHNFY